MKKVLIIDDEPSIVEALTTLMGKMEGVEAAGATDPELGLRKAKSWKPDVVIMDLTMPKLDGWEATRRLKADPATKDIPVVILTAVLTPALQQQVEQSGAARLITKPCDLGDLRRMLLSLDRGLETEPQEPQTKP